jgi:uncharacterized protein YdhG (YjbR/CyaY superfamily)
MGAPRTVEDYLSGVPQEARGALEDLRKTIQTAVPEATESISYQMPTFRYRGRPLVGFAAFKNHCSFFPMSPKVLDAHKEELASFQTSKGTIRFTADKPLPAALVTKLVKAGIRETETRKAPG